LKKYQFLYILSISAIVALGVKFVGGLLVAGLTALPAASARNLSKNLKTFRFLSSLFGIFSAILGIFLSQIIKSPVGLLIILSGFLFFLISIIFKK
jgi:ABC-type Mn2+/Zn2+ transport system permease subunit